MNKKRLLTVMGGVVKPLTDPTTIEGLQIWYDFSDPSTIFVDDMVTPVSGDGDAIYGIADKSGNSKHAKQATAELRPLYKTNIKNLLSAGLWDGTNDLLSFTELNLTDFTVYAVCTRRKDSAIIGGASLLDYINSGASDNSSIDIRPGGNVNFVIIPFVAGVIEIVCFSRGSGSISEFSNSIASVSNPKTNTDAWNPSILGSRGGTTAPMNGYEMEILIYNTNHSAKTRKRVTDYLNTKWSVF